VKSIGQSRVLGIGLLIGQLALAGCASSGSSGESEQARRDRSADSTYSEKSVLRQAEDAFGEGAEGIGDLVKRAFKRYGPPNAVIRGEEAGGAFVGGLRYGKGQLFYAGGGTRTLYWQSPSIGLDAGGNAAKTFIMIYRLRSTQDLFQRFPAVDGSLYVIGGAGLNYNQADETVLAVIRAGVGWRAGISIGYLKFTPEATANPF
jgi:hypothetical protein